MDEDPPMDLHDLPPVEQPSRPIRSQDLRPDGRPSHETFASWMATVPRMLGWIG